MSDPPRAGRRTPLNAIMGLNSLMLEDPGVPAPLKEYIHASQVSADVLLGQITNLLEFARWEGGSAPNASVAASREEFLLRNLLCELLEIVAPRAERKGVQVVVDVVEPSLGGRVLVGDPFRIRQALINVVQNALVFSTGLVVLTAQVVAVGPEHDASEGGETEGGAAAAAHRRRVAERSRSAPASCAGWCRAASEAVAAHGSSGNNGDAAPAAAAPPKRRMLEFLISDDGPGIAPHNRARLFRAFTQLVGDGEAKRTGQGLGLVVTARILNSLGGTIELVDSPAARAASCFNPPFFLLLWWLELMAHTRPALRERPLQRDYFRYSLVILSSPYLNIRRARARRSPSGCLLRRRRSPRTTPQQECRRISPRKTSQTRPLSATSSQTGRSGGCTGRAAAPRASGCRQCLWPFARRRLGCVLC